MLADCCTHLRLELRSSVDTASPEGGSSEAPGGRARSSSMPRTPVATLRGPESAAADGPQSTPSTGMAKASAARYLRSATNARERAHDLKQKVHEMDSSVYTSRRVPPAKQEQAEDMAESSGGSFTIVRQRSPAGGEAEEVTSAPPERPLAELSVNAPAAQQPTVPKRRLLGTATAHRLPPAHTGQF
mmetsp:Transcript_23287/g.64643  ORF Transcript_23287/g.64643 Transcript_23287/m.64643 type:complete len:187 (-) Transcript_23287:28-588(-)